VHVLDTSPEQHQAQAQRLLKPIPYADTRQEAERLKKRFFFKPVIQYVEEKKYRENQYAFYQYAYSKPEITDFLRRNGFEPVTFHPYDPGRVIKKGLRSVSSYLIPRQIQDLETTLSDSSIPHPYNLWSKFRSDALKKCLYSKPLLWFFAHMSLVVAKVSSQCQRLA
jgi:hypothetical protein